MGWLTRLLYRFLDQDRKIDYAVLFLIGLLPMVYAAFVGVDQAHEADGIRYLGYLDKYNFWPFFAVMPFSLWLVRYEYGLIATISPPTLPERPPALIQLFRAEAQREAAYQIMRGYLGAPRVMTTVLVIAIGINYLDTRELVDVYLNQAPVREGEYDFTVMYQIGVLTRAENLVMVVLAYIVQFLMTVIGVFCVVFLLFHNLYFLNRIYQRRRVHPGQEGLYINIDLDDVNKCFGFRGANSAFNTQVVALIIGGLIVLISRFANVGYVGEGTTLAGLLESPEMLSQAIIFPDIGQVLLAIFWIIALGIVSLPALVKLLPRFPAGGESPPVTITNYLREFLADDQWSYGDKPSSKEIDYIAAKFAENSFWPTGDNRAGQLFFFAIATFLLILYPVKTPDLALFLVSMVFVAAIAYSVRSLFFLMLNSSLSFVDERLTLKRPELISEMESSQIAIRSRVFISYRREDSAPYARLIHQSLSDFMDENEIFMDIEAIDDGDDFVQAIETAVSDCDVMLVVVGKRWANISADDGEKRLFQVRDFVRLEVASALKQDCHVIPVLVGGAEMPVAGELPPDLEAFVRRHARELSDKRWDGDIQQLARAMAEN